MKITGFTSYKQKTSMQRPDVFGAFDTLLRSVMPSRVLEIGTAYGATTHFLRDKLDEIGLESSDLLSININKLPVYEELRKLNIDILIGNFFDASITKTATDFIRQDGVSLILCDGGNKKREFNTLAPFIKPGDVLMAHDYIDTLDNFEANFKDKIWNWREIGDEFIEEACVDNNLEPFLQDTFTPEVWVCKRKTL